MIHRPSRSLEVLSISALDLFASALGVFILVAILLFPFYLKQPSLNDALAGARATLSAAADSNTASKRRSQNAKEEQTAAEQAIAAAEADLALAETEREEARATASTAAARRQQLAQQQAAATEQLANLFVTDLDIVFVMDATGSMDDEIADVQANLLGIVRVLNRLAPSLHVGFVAYKDPGFAYVTKVLPLTDMATDNLRRAQAFVDSLDADGGGDHPESLDIALKEAVALDWRANAQGRIIIVGDAPARRQNWNTTFEHARNFQASAVQPGLPRYVSAVFSGSRPADRAFFERLARAGGGDFVAHRGQMMESVLLSVLTKGPDTR